MEWKALQVQSRVDKLELEVEKRHKRQVPFPLPKGYGALEERVLNLEDALIKLENPHKKRKVVLPASWEDFPADAVAFHSRVSRLEEDMEKLFIQEALARRELRLLEMRLEVCKDSVNEIISTKDDASAPEKLI